MDPFTQKLLDRTRQRREILQKKLHDKNGSSSDAVGTSSAAKLLDQITSTTNVPSKECTSKETVKAHPVPAPRSITTPEKSKIGDKENSNRSNENPSAVGRIESMQSTEGVNQKREQWDSAMNSIMSEEKTVVKPQGVVTG